MFASQWLSPMILACLILAVLGLIALMRSIHRLAGLSAQAAASLAPIDGRGVHPRELRETVENLNRLAAGCKRTEESLRSSEERLMQAQKMEAVGRISGGVAHDFNNLLTVMIGYADMTLMSPDLGPLARASLEELRESASRAAMLTRQLLAFGRRQVMHPVIIDPNWLLSRLKGMLLPILGEEVALSMELDPSAGCFKADEGQIEQAVLNLVINARDAMPEGGTLTIRTSRSILAGSLFADELPLAAGPHVVIEVTDDGVGMDKATQEHLFEPFFTTKREGEGTGLGLSTVYGIVTQSGGHVGVQSEPHRGSTFRLFFPQVVDRRAHETASGPAAPGLGGGERILVVEDDRSVRRMIASSLKKAGYHVREVGGGMEALSYLSSANEADVDLILSDVVMPDMTGDQLVERLPARYAKTRILYMTGYDGRRDLGDAPVICKPFSPAVIATRIREVLDAPLGQAERRRRAGWMW